MGVAYVEPIHNHDTNLPERWINVNVEHNGQVWYSTSHARCIHPEHRKHKPVQNPLRRRAGMQTAALESGCYYPRIWRGGVKYKLHNVDWFPVPFVEETLELDSFVIALEQLEILFDDLSSVFRHVHPKVDNCRAFGSRIRQLLIAACTEVECSWRAVLVANEYPVKKLTTKNYHKVHSPLKLDDYRLALRRYPHYPAIAPFAGWDASASTESIPWYDAYNKVKHYREVEFKQATLENAIGAVGACVILIAAQFGPHSLERFNCESIFKFESVPVWPITDWYLDPIDGNTWNRVFFPF